MKPEDLKLENVGRKVLIDSIGNFSDCRATLRAWAKNRKTVLGERPTGIIRTLPYGADRGKRAMRAALRRMYEGLRRLNADDDALVYIGMAQKPKIEVLYFYLLAGNRIIGRANIAEWAAAEPDLVYWDNVPRKCTVWAVLTGPFVEPPERIMMRGFQGFRYTGDLW